MRTIPDALFKENWADLDDQEHRLFATYVIATLLYPPATKDEEGTEWRRRKAVHALWSKRVIGQVDALLAAVMKGELVTDLAHVQTLAAPISAYWHDNWVDTLRRAGSPTFYNHKKLKTVWPKWVNLYLVACALIRLRNHEMEDASGGDPGLRQANWLVLKTYPRNCGYERAAKGLESLAQSEKAIWPLVCGLMHCLVHQHVPKKKRDGSSPPSLHSLVSFDMPTTRGAIKTIRKEPERMLRASRFFMAQLAEPVKRRVEPILNQSDCVELPQYKDFQSTRSRPAYLAKLAEDEVKVASRYNSDEYSALKSNDIKARHSPRSKAD